MQLKNKSWIFFLIFFVLFFVFGCSKEDSPVFRVALAANTQYVMEEMKELYSKETGEKIEPIIGSSGKLYKQIVEGAPFALFLSADQSFAKMLQENQLNSGEPVTYAQGVLVFWSLKKEMVKEDFSDMLGTEYLKIGYCNPALAPYGKAALEYLKNSGMYEKIQNKLIEAESISQVNQYILTENVTGGFTAKASAVAPAMKGKGFWKEVPARGYAPIKQDLIITSYGNTNLKEKAQKFAAFILSDKGREVFMKYGYGVPSN